MADTQPIAAPELEAVLDELLEVEFTFRSTEEPVSLLVQLGRSDQDFMMDWIRRVASTHLELGYQVACHGTRALQNMDRHIIESWALHVMDVYDRFGLRPALDVINTLDTFIQDQHRRLHGAILQEQSGVLLGFVHGLSGRKLKIAESASTYTDTETLYLPPIQAEMPSELENFQLYKVTVVFLWAQTRFGTFSLLRRVGALSEPVSTPLLELFFAMECLRLEGIIARELPGLHRELDKIQLALAEHALPQAWQAIKKQLAAANATSADAMKLAQEHLGRLEPYSPKSFHGELNLEAVRDCMEARIEREKAYIRVSLKEILDEQQDKLKRRNGDEEPKFSAQKQQDDSKPEGLDIQILIDDQPLLMPPEMANAVTSVIMDFSDLPEEYLVPAGDGEYDPNFFKEPETDPDEVWSGTYHEEGAYLYDEWDFQRKHYRKNWCAVREKNVKPVYDDFVQQTLNKYTGLIKHLRKTFEAMRDEDRLLKRQPHGDGVDIDALVEALADSRRGTEMTDRLFTRMHRTERNIAVVFMVDMSGSTKGWINEAERESLILLCEALESLGDRYAIYGFSSLTRKRCEIFHIKHFDENYDAEIKARINGIQPQDYTRMGFAIRHLTKVLKAVDAKTRMLITLSDGKPDDYDIYRGVYGIEDTRRALIEARQDGIHPYCITIDEEAKDYLPHLYGPAAFTVINEVRALPLKVSDIYRRLTT